MQRLILIPILIFIVACSSVNTDDKKKFEGVLKKKDDLKNLTIKASLSPDTPDLNMSFSSVVDIAEKDSLRMKLYAMFGIEAARIFISEDKFLVYRVFEGQAMQGDASAGALEKVANINLEFDDLISFMRSDIPGDPASYKFEKDFGDGRSLYRSTQKGDYLEFVTIDPDGNILQYQQQNSNGKTKLNVFYEDYKMWNNFSLAGLVNIKLPAQNASLEIDIDEYLFPDSFENLSLDIPDQIEIEEFK